LDVFDLLKIALSGADVSAGSGIVGIRLRGDFAVALASGGMAEMASPVGGMEDA
jgi:hypothetical protein